MGTAASRNPEGERVKKFKKNDRHWKTEGEFKLKCRTTGKGEIIRLHSPSKNKNDNKNSFLKKKRDNGKDDRTSAKKGKKFLSRSRLMTKEVHMQKDDVDFPSKVIKRIRPSSSQPPSSLISLEHNRNTSPYKPVEISKSTETSRPLLENHVKARLTKSRKTDRKLNDRIQSLFEQDILPELPNWKDKANETVNVDVKAHIQSLEDLSRGARSKSPSLLLARQINCPSETSVASSVYSNEELNSIDVLCSGSKRSFIESASENTLSSSLPSLISNHKKADEKWQNKENQKEERFRQLEELGLGFVQEGKWIPTDVISRTIWNGVAKTKGCCAEWSHHQSKTFKEPKLLHDQQ